MTTMLTETQLKNSFAKLTKDLRNILTDQSEINS